MGGERGEEERTGTGTRAERGVEEFPGTPSGAEPGADERTGAAATRAGRGGARADDEAAGTEREAGSDDAYRFPHPEWTVGLVLVFAVVSLIFGLLVRPVFLLVGAPFIIVLLLWVTVRLVTFLRFLRSPDTPDDGGGSVAR